MAAAFRVDFADWLGTLEPRERRLATDLAAGETTSDMAKKYSVSSGRVSQIRRVLENALDEFQSEAATEAPEPRHAT